MIILSLGSNDVASVVRLLHVRDSIDPFATRYSIISEPLLKADLDYCFAFCVSLDIAHSIKRDLFSSVSRSKGATGCDRPLKLPVKAFA